MSNERVYYSHDAQMQAIRDMIRLAVGAIVVGAGIGAVIALLFAPSSGEKTRKNIGKAVEEGLQSGREAVEPIVNRIEKDFSTLQSNVEERVNNLK